MRAVGRLCRAGIGLLCWCSAAMAGDAEALVERMMAASRTLDYDGIFIYQRDGNLETLRVMHRGSREPEKERLESLNGPARAVIRDGEKVTLRGRDDGPVLMGGPTPRVAPNFTISGSLAGLAPSYGFELQPTLDRVAGRDAQVVHVRPRTRDRYAYKLWIDRDTALLLKSVILDAQDRALEQEQFATVAIGVPLADEVFATASEAGERAVSTPGPGSDLSSSKPGTCSPPPCAAPGGENPTPGAPDWQVGWLPPGFTRHGEHVPATSPTAGPTPHFVYSDGLATVAVFVERLAKEAAPLQGFTFMGAVSTFSRVAADHQITVIGELPQATVRRIALSIAPQAPTGQH